jgi:mono/diheme cytochrome c family protein
MKPTKMFLRSALLASAVTAIALPAAAQELKPEDVRLPEMTPELSRGELNYGLRCGSCHGKNLIGTDKGPPFLHPVYHKGHHGDKSFYIASKQGAKAHHWNFGDMKPVEGITDAQIASILTYIRAVQAANGL